MTLEVDKKSELLRDHCPGLAAILKSKGHMTVLDYSADFYDYEHHSIQSIDDFIAVVGRYSERTLGNEIAGMLVDVIARVPVVMTANHHGVSYNAMTVQSDIIYSLAGIYGREMTALPVFLVLACGIVPLSNVSFPRGILLSREIEQCINPGVKRHFKLKIPILPNKASQCLVSFASPVERKHLIKAKKRIESESFRGSMQVSESKAVMEILDEDYSSAEVLKRASYSDQSVIINHRLWRRFFSPEVREKIPDIAHLEMERVVVSLLEMDLSNQESLLYNVLFDPELQEKVIHNLDGEYGCWDQKLLTDLYHNIDKHTAISEEFRGCGTDFLMFVDSHGRRVPALLKYAAGKPVLLGIEAGRKKSIPLAPAAIRKGLKNRSLMPGLFVSFAVLAFARGIKCVGGFMQVEYLPAMQQGLVRSLIDVGQRDWADKIAQIPTANFLTGINAIMARYADGLSRPAGAIELIASGGLTAGDLDKIKEISVKDANLSGLNEFYARIVFDDEHLESDFNSDVTSEMQSIRTRLLEINLR